MPVLQPTTSKMAQQSQGTLGNVFKMAGLGSTFLHDLVKLPHLWELVLHHHKNDNNVFTNHWAVF